MSYQVLARKYRPQRFADVAGQQHVTVTLMNALVQGRVAHGYIFSGHRGIGKTTIARILAMALNCRNTIGSKLRPSAEPCEVCESCTEVRAGNAVDVIEIDAATNRGIDEIRELRDAARYRPSRDRFKIYILDEAHQITDAAFNALLKTLEEPPDHIVFMMATTQPEDIPQTVRSRCQNFSFRAVKLEDILIELRSIAVSENLDADDAALNLVAEAGDGSMRDALSVMDQAIASALTVEGRPSLHAAQIRELLGTVSNVVFERMLEAIDAGRAADLITTANEQMDAGNSPVQLAKQLVRYLRSTLLAKIVHLAPETVDAPGSELLQISADERRRAARSATLFSEEELTRFLQVMLRTFDELGYRQEQRVHFEVGLMKLLHLRRLLPLEELLSQLPVTPAAARGSARAALPAAPLQVASPATVSVPAALTPAKSAAAPPQVAQPVFSPFEADRQRKSVAAEPGDEARPTATAPFDTPIAAARSIAVIDPSAGLLDPAASDVSAQSHAAGVIEQAHVDAAPEPGGEVDAAGSRPDGLREVERLRSIVLDALGRAKGQSSAADALTDAEWSIDGGVIRAQTQLSKTMLGVVLNAEAMQLARAALAAEAGGPWRLEAVAAPAGSSGGAKKAAPRAARSGSAEARAQQHPVVQEAQRLFNAEIRNVIDLSSK